MAMTRLFTNQATTANSSAVVARSGAGRLVHVTVVGTDLGTGASVMTLQVSPDDGTTWISTGQATSAGATSGTLTYEGHGTQFRVAFTQGTASTADIWISVE